MSEISLTASMRSNLLSLQNTASLMDQTQERLSTGKKVNSAIDNPSSYYTAQSLTNRASDLSGLLDSMGQAISTIKAADEGITAITAFVEQAKAVANSAAETKDAGDRAKYMEQFNTIRDQIDELARDSGYKGVNLINGDSLTVTFNEDRSSRLDIAAQDATVDGLALGKAADWGKISDATTTAEAELTAAQDALDEQLDAEKTGSAAKTLAAAKTTYEAARDVWANSAQDTAALATWTTAQEAWATAQEAYDDVIDPLKEAVAEKEAALIDAQKADELKQTSLIVNSINASSDAINKLRSIASELGNNYSIVETRESFTQNLVNVLEEGADKLTLADMNEESANMLALQTRQQLAINSLSLASQAAQSVLALF